MLVEDGMREARERFKLGLFGDAAAVSFGNVQIIQYEKGDQDEEFDCKRWTRCKWKLEV